MLTSVTGTVTQHLEARMPATNLGLVVDEVGFSFAQLKAAARSGADVWRSLGGPELLGVGISERSNSIKFKVLAADVVAASELVDELVIHLGTSALIQEAVRSVDTVCTRTNCHTPTWPSDTANPDITVWGADTSLTSEFGDSGSPVYRKYLNELWAIGTLSNKTGHIARIEDMIGQWSSTIYTNN